VKPNLRQQMLLDAMKAGMSFEQAYQHAGYSLYGNNAEIMLMRLVRNGWIQLKVVV
jgi:hypothetical protein